MTLSALRLVQVRVGDCSGTDLHSPSFNLMDYSGFHNHSGGHGFISATRSVIFFLFQYEAISLPFGFPCTDTFYHTRGICQHLKDPNETINTGCFRRVGGVFGCI